MVQFSPDDLSTVPAAPTELSSASKHAANTVLTSYAHTRHTGTHISALTYIIHAYVCSHNDNKVLKLKKKDQEKMHSSTNGILKKNKLKQPRREDEVALSIPLLDLHTACGSAGTFRVVPGCHLDGFLAVVTRLCSCVLPYIQVAPVTTRGFVLLPRLCLSSVPGCKTCRFAVCV